MTINVRVRDGMCPDPTTGDGGATEGDIRGSFSDIIDTIGVVDLANGHCAVTENSPAALSVLVAPGIVYIPNANYDELDSNTVKFWEAIVTVLTAVTITANTSGSTRIDLICAKMDTAVTPDEHASNIATLVAVAGTPGAGTPATPDNHYVLATVAVANGASTIVNVDITSTRVQSKIDFDFLPKATGAEINTGTSDVTIVTPKAIADSKVSITDKVETLTNKTLTSPKINENVALTATATELNTLDGSVPRKSILIGSSNGSILAAGATVYVGTHYNSGSSSYEVSLTIPFASTIKNLYVFTTSSPGADKSYVCTIVKNDVNTVITGTISGAASNSCNDTTHSFTAAAGDRICLKVVTTAGAASLALQFSVECDMS